MCNSIDIKLDAKENLIDISSLNVTFIRMPSRKDLMFISFIIQRCPENLVLIKSNLNRFCFIIKIKTIQLFFVQSKIIFF
jgi:hypothetical protein